MKERPILFSTSMVQAQLDGIKTQTRRLNGLDIINKNPDHWVCSRLTLKEPNGYPNGYIYASFVNRKNDSFLNRKCPFGQPGDMLWVRETFTTTPDHKTILYKADPFYSNLPKDDLGRDWDWTPSIFMPRWACRTLLQIVNIRVERLQNISEEDAFSEGVTAEIFTKDGISYDKLRDCGNYYKPIFKHLWESINTPDSWIKNPWVWVLDFKQNKVLL